MNVEIPLLGGLEREFPLFPDIGAQQWDPERDVPYDPERDDPYDSERDVLFPSSGKAFDKHRPAHQRFLKAIEERQAAFQQRPNKGSKEGKRIKKELIDEVIAATHDADKGIKARFFVQLDDKSLSWEDKEQMSEEKLLSRIDSRLRTNQGKKKAGSAGALEEEKNQEKAESGCPVWKYRLLHSPEDLIDFDVEDTSRRIEKAYQNHHHDAGSNDMMQSIRQDNYEIKVEDGTLWDLLPASDENRSAQGKRNRVLVGTVYRCPPSLTKTSETPDPMPISCPATDGAKKMAPRQQGSASSSFRAPAGSSSEANANRKRKSSSQASNDNGAGPQDSVLSSSYRLATPKECFAFVEELFKFNDDTANNVPPTKQRKVQSTQEDEAKRKSPSAASADDPFSPSESTSSAKRTDFPLSAGSIVASKKVDDKKTASLDQAKTSDSIGIDESSKAEKPEPYDPENEILHPSKDEVVDEQLPAHQRHLKSIKERHTAFLQRPNKRSKEANRIKKQLTEEVTVPTGTETRSGTSNESSGQIPKEET